MHLDLGQFSPDIKLGLVSASRDCFPRALSEQRTARLREVCAGQGIELVAPEGECAIIESKAHARDAAAQLIAAGCDAAVLYLGNFSPEIEDANFAKAFGGPLMVIAAAEESAGTLAGGRGDALCGLLSAAMALRKRGLDGWVHLPEQPVVGAEAGVVEIARFIQIMKVVKGARNATIGLFGPRPRDFETCNYSVAALASIGVEVEEFGFFDLANEVEAVKAGNGTEPIRKAMREQMPSIPKDVEFEGKLSAYEQAVLNLRERHGLSGMATQCWSEQEFKLQHVPCFINGRMAGAGFPIACENDAYSLVAELLAQYASDQMVTILDINHSIPLDLGAGLDQYHPGDLVGMFHCGNTNPAKLKNPEMKHQVIMKRLMEPDGEPDITRGTIEGQIAASPITVVQVQAEGDRLRAYVCEGEFLDLDPKTFGCTGTAHIPGFERFYRHVLLGRYHHHAAVAFAHCADILYDALKLLGVETIDVPLAECVPYPGENIFRRARTTGRMNAVKS